NGATESGESHEIVGLLERRCEWFLDEQRHAAIEESARDAVVVAGRRDDRRGIDLIEKWAVMCVCAASVAFGDEAGLGGADVRDADELDVRHGGEDAGVGLSQMSDTDDRHPHRGHTHSEWAVMPNHAATRKDP